MRAAARARRREWTRGATARETYLRCRVRAYALRARNCRGDARVARVPFETTSQKRTAVRRKRNRRLPPAPRARIFEGRFIISTLVRVRRTRIGARGTAGRETAARAPRRRRGGFLGVSALCSVRVERWRGFIMSQHAEARDEAARRRERARGKFLRKRRPRARVDYNGTARVYPTV